MMRRGPLDRYPVDWVLRQAADHEVSGTIELHTDAPATVFLRAGRVCAVERGIVEEASAHGEGPELEGAARERSAAALAAAVRTPGGWYYHHPLGGHDLDVAWRWDGPRLLADAQAQVAQPSAPPPPAGRPIDGGRVGDARGSEPSPGLLGPWAGAMVSLRPPPTGVGVGVDAWTVVAALTEVVPVEVVVERLRWAPERVAGALADLAGAGLVASPAAARPGAAPIEAHGRIVALRPSASRSPVEADVAEVAEVAATRARAGSVARGPVEPEPRPWSPWGHGPGAEPADASPAVVPAPPPPGRPAARRPTVAVDERRGALRRLISSLRPA